MTTSVPTISRRFATSGWIVGLLGALLGAPLSADPPLQPALGSPSPTAPEVEIVTAAVEVQAEGHRIVIALDRFEDGQSADGRVDQVFSFDADEPVERFFFVGFGVVRLQPEALLVTLADSGVVFDLAVSGAPTGEPSVRAGLVRHRDGRELYSYTPARDEELSPGEALDTVLRRTPLRSATAPIFEKDPTPGGDAGCAKSCSVTGHSGRGCSTTCGLGECAECSLDPLECKCVPAG